jgi:DNA-binding beta-propeller fold protein YncE
MLHPRIWLGGIALAFAACRAPDGVAQTDTLVRPLDLDPRLRPQFRSTISRPDAPPPISGGTLATSKTSRLAVASDPDRDRVYVVDLSLRAVRYALQLAPKTEPGRVALDEAGHAFVALRRSGELATINLTTGSVDVRTACAAPRGVAFDRWRNQVLLACASGSLMAFPQAGGVPSSISGLGLDLRDVVVRADGLDLTSFRSARLQSLTPDGARGELVAPSLPRANLAWRMRDLGNDDGEPLNVVVAQEPSSALVSTKPGGYGEGGGFDCGASGIVTSRLWIARMRCEEDDTAQCTHSVPLPGAVLPVDVATNGHELVVVAAGNGLTPALPQLFVVAAQSLRTRHPMATDCFIDATRGNVSQGQAIAADFSSLDELIVQTREPAQLHIMSDDRLRTVKTIALATDSRADTGHEIFHANAGGIVACASCHAEGADDGHVWSFDESGPRRTPSLLGTTAHTEPFHWNGEMKDLATLVDRVFVERMAGPKLEPAQVEALGNYLFALPAPPRLRSVLDVSPRGKDSFEKKCTVCHSGSMLTNNQTLDVGTGGKFQVPSLVGVAWRGPWIHNGCANTLFERFNPDCGGLHHAELGDLTDADKAYLVEYMESL